MKRIYAVLALSICVLLSLSSCSVWNNSPLEDLSTVTIPYSFIQFTGMEMDEFIESLSLNRNDIYTRVETTEENVVSLTVEIKAILVMSLIRALSFGFYYTFQM